MNDFVDSFAYWLADFFLATTALFSVALVALALMKQPAKRIAVVKAALLAAFLLTFLCALPGWSLVHLASTVTDSPRPTVIAPSGNANAMPAMPLESQRLPVSVLADTVTTPAVTTAPAWSPSWLAAVLAAYGLGSAAVVLRLVLGKAFARRLLSAAAPATAEVESLLTTVLTEERSRPRLRVSREIDVAAALGIFRPTVLLPSSWALESAPSELRTVLAHECAHVRNGDLKWLALSRLASVALWPQPLYWLVRRRMRFDQETLADAAAAEFSSRVTYAEQLVKWARAVPSRPRPALAVSVGLWESPSQLRQRVAVLLDEHFPVLRECSRRLRWTSLVVYGVFALGLSVVTVRPTLSEEDVGLESQAIAAVDGIKKQEISGRVILPDGTPAAGISVTAYSMVDPDNLTLPQGYQRGITDSDGRFRLSLYSGGKEVIWILPRDYVQQTHVINGQRGDLGDFQLATGLYFHGRVIDEDAKPIGSIWVNAELVDGPAKQKIEMPVADNVERAALTNADGTFHLGPLPAGIYRVGPDEMPEDDFRNLDQSRRALPAAFLPQRLELNAASELEEMEIKPVDSVNIEVRFVDSQGHPTEASGFFLIGTGPDGKRVAYRRGPVRSGQSQQVVSFDVPKGLARTVLDFPSSSMRVRRLPTDPWENDFSLDLGTLDHDWLKIEAVRYRAPTLVVTASDAAGNAIADFKPAIFYHYLDKQEPRKERWIDDVRGDIDFGPRPNGGWQSENLLPDEEFTLTISAAGYQPFEVKKSISEGRVEEVVAELKPLANSTTAQESASSGNTDSTTSQTQHKAVGGGTVTTFVAGTPATPWDYKPNVLAFKVQDEAARPLAGVEAIVYRTSPQTGERSEVGRALTNAGGEVDFAGLVEAKWATAIQKMAAGAQPPQEIESIFFTVLRRDGLATVILPASDFSIEIRGIQRTVRMRPAAELSGRVTDKNGKPVAGALVAAGGLAGTFAMEGVNAVRTNAEGRYRLSNVVAFNRAAGERRLSEWYSFATAAQHDASKLYPAVYDPAEETSVSNLTVTHPNFAVTTVRGGDVPGVTDVVMQPNSMIAGRVVEFGTGRPVMGARIKTVGKMSEAEGNESLHIASTLSDAVGEYRLSNLPAGTYEVWAEEAGDVANKQGRVSRGLVDIVTSAEKSRVRLPDIVLGPGATIRGRLIDGTTGKPLEQGDREMTVKVVTQLINPFGNQGSPLRQTAVDRDGRFSVQVNPGRSRVYLLVYTNAPGSTLQGDYRSADDEFEVGPEFDLKHGESRETDFKVWSAAKIEEKRAKTAASLKAKN